MAVTVRMAFTDLIDGCQHITQDDDGLYLATNGPEPEVIDVAATMEAYGDILHQELAREDVLLDYDWAFTPLGWQAQRGSLSADRYSDADTESEWNSYLEVGERVWQAGDFWRFI